LSHVYILGAGFSVPLGGPLFTQLLSPELFRFRQKLDLEEPWGALIEKICTCKNLEALGFLGLLASDVETLLERIDSLSRNLHPSNELLVQTVMDNNGFRWKDINLSGKEFLSQLSERLRRVLACECEGFLDELDQGSDRWTPFDRWINDLNSIDSIVSFNYDTTIERLLKRNKKQFLNFFKLHGSVDTYLVNGAFVKKENAFLDGSLPLSICTPGLMKSNVAEEPGDFRTCWTIAKQSIAKCSVLSIVGYSMPFSDNKARMMILDAIADNKELRKVNLVLGPASQTTAAGRIETMVRAAFRSSMTPRSGERVVNDLKLYAQDYLPYVLKYRI
jgi:hypothetical protein